MGICASHDEQSKFKFIELFAGIGGFRVGMEQLGGQCVFSSEIEPHAAAVYATNHGEKPSGDIMKVPSNAIPPFDVLTAGFPCQSFSAAGEQRGLDDPRGQLFWEIVRVAKHHRPGALLLENVSNLLRIDQGHTLHQLLEALAEIGYHCRIQLVNAAALVPQDRVRVFIVGFRDAATAATFTWPVFLTPRPCRIRDILETLPRDELSQYQLSPAEWTALCESPPYKARPQERHARLEGAARTLVGSHWRVTNSRCEFVPTTLPPDPDLEHSAQSSEQEASRGMEIWRRDIFSGLDVRLESSVSGSASPAVVPVVPVVATPDAEAGGKEDGTVPVPDSSCSGVNAPRFLTPRECARIQGFPDSFILTPIPDAIITSDDDDERDDGSNGGKGRPTKTYRLLGNAVCPPVIKAIGAHVIAALEVAYTLQYTTLTSGPFLY